MEMNAMQPSELDILEIISSVGQARSFYIEAIQEAKSKNYEGCNELVRKGNEMYAKGHRIHQLMIQEEAGGNHIPYLNSLENRKIAKFVTVIL